TSPFLINRSTPSTGVIPPAEGRRRMRSVIPLGTTNVFVSLQVSIAVSRMIPPPEYLCIKSQDHDNLISFISPRLRGSLDLLFPPEKNLPPGRGLEPFGLICLMGTMKGSSDWDLTATSTL